MNRLLLLLMVVLVSGCTTDLKFHLGKRPASPCPVFAPAEKEYPPLGVSLEMLPYEDADAVALILASEVKSLRDYIHRQDERDRKAYADYRVACMGGDKTVQAGPSN